MESLTVCKDANRVNRVNGIVGNQISEGGRAESSWIFSKNFRKYGLFYEGFLKNQDTVASRTCALGHCIDLTEAGLVKI